MNTVIIRRPDLTPEERAKRMEEIKQAAKQLIIKTETAKQKKGRPQK